MCARFDHQFGDGKIPVDPAAADDFQPSGIDVALELAADDDVIGLQVAHDFSLLANRDLRLGANRALDATVDVQVIAQGKVADKL